MTVGTKYVGAMVSGRTRVAALRATAVGVALLWCVDAHAQTASAQPAASSAGVSEVIVTATKRGQAIIDVPQTVTAIASQSLAQFNIQAFTDYGNKIPNLSFNTGSVGRANFSSSRGVTVRGVVGTNTTALYIDDTSIPITQDPRIVDIDRIEVLKGPQGTLFGAGAIGGTIRVITKQPSFSGPEFKYMAQAGGTDHGGSPDVGANMIGNVVVVPDKVAVRIMGFFQHDSGFVSRQFASAPGVNVKVNDTGAETSYGGSVSSKFQVNDDFTANAKLLMQREDYPNGWPLVYRGLTSYAPTSLTEQRSYDVPEYSHNSWFLPALTLNYSKGKLSLTSATSYYYQTSSDSEDVSEAMHQVIASRYNGYTFAGGVRGGGDAQNTRVQQEFRASYDWGPFSGIGGAYIAHQVADSQSAKRTINGLAESATGAQFGIVNDIYFAQTVHNISDEDALFGELSYKPIDQVTITGGLRQYWLNQHNQNTVQGFVLALANPRLTTSQTAESGLSPKVNIKWEPTRDTTLYASAAKGFRPGAPGATLSPFCASDLARLGVTSAEVQAGYKSDSVWSYEVGAKQAVGERRVLATAALFQTDWKDIQQVVSLPSCGSSFTGNAGAARVRGAEAELNGAVTRELSLRAGIGYTDARITDDNHGSTGQKVGDRLYGVPELTATIGAVYTREIRADIDGFVSGDWSYVGSSTSINNGTTTPAILAAYSILNLRVGARKAGNELSLYVNNASNTFAALGDHVPDISQTITINGKTVPYSRVSVSRPISAGVQFRHNF